MSKIKRTVNVGFRGRFGYWRPVQLAVHLAKVQGAVGPGARSFLCCRKDCSSATSGALTMHLGSAW